MTTKTNNNKAVDVYQIVTERMIKALETGVIPWRRTWTEGMPVNWVTQKPYHGINLFMLPGGGEYMTFKQAQQAGGSVKKGEHGHLITYFKMLEKKTDKKDKDGNPEVVRIPMLRYYYVFHISQVEGIESKQSTVKHELIKECENVVELYSKELKEVTHYDDGAYYCEVLDKVNVPEINKFEKPELYYSAMFHEMTHSTGHPKRLNRFAIDGDDHVFASESYSREELVAEMGASILLGMMGAEIAEETFDINSAYIVGWLEKLQNDKKLIVWAAGRAAKAAEYITRGACTVKDDDDETDNVEE